MKKWILFLMLVMFIPSVVSGQGDVPRRCKLEGTIEEFVQHMNTVGEMIALLDGTVTPKVNIDKCSYEIINTESGAYVCKITSSTQMVLYTDQYKNFTFLHLYGPIENGKVKDVTFDLAYNAASAACINLYMPESNDIFLEAVTVGSYIDDSIIMVSGPDPNMDDTWSFFIGNN